MKKKLDEYGNHYIFSTDKGIEMTCVAIVECLKYLDVKPTSDIDKFHLAGQYYLDHAPEDAMIFKRKPDLSVGDDTTDAMTWINTCVKLITDSYGYKETRLNVTLKDGRENKGGVGYKIGSDGCIYTYTLSTPFRYLKMSTEVFQTILDENEMTFDELHWQFYNQIIDKIRRKMFNFKKMYPSLEWVKEENPYNNYESEEQDINFTFTKQNAPKTLKNMSDTMDVFDGI